jgi:hypothetical protein
MPRRNMKHRKTTLSWTSDDEPYNTAAMRTFVELFQHQHDEPEPHIALFVDEMLTNFADHGQDLDAVINELVRRRIEREMKR